MFQESWIPAIKSGNYKQFELYGLSTDPGQLTDLSAQLPKVTARLKKELLEITASVMADGPGWIKEQLSPPSEETVYLLRFEPSPGWKESYPSVGQRDCSSRAENAQVQSLIIENESRGNEIEPERA